MGDFSWGAVVALVLLCIAFEELPVRGSEAGSTDITGNGRPTGTGPSVQALPPITPLPDTGSMYPYIAPVGYTEEVETELMRQFGAALSNGDLSLLTEPGAARTTVFGEGKVCNDPWPGVRCRFVGSEKFVYLIDFRDVEPGVLTGTLSAAVTNLFFLRKLYLSNLGLTGTLPAELSDATFNFDVEHNAISGTVAPNFAYQMDSLLLGWNKLSGTIHEELIDGNNRLFSQLRFDHNRFSGVLPSNVGSGEATTFDISFNQLSGTLPELWDSLSSLSSTSLINVANNNLAGTIPRMLLNQTRFTQIDLSNNQLSGTLEQASFSATYGSRVLMSLKLSNNRVSGFLPNADDATIGGPLNHLWLDNNLMSGYITEEMFSSHPGLETFYASSNRLSGTLPRFYDSLYWMEIAGNSLSGFLPQDRAGNGFPRRLQIFKAQGNNFSQDISTAFYNADLDPILDLMTLDLSDNLLFGNFPEDVLFGNYPAEFVYNVANIERLNLARNNISGTLPANLGSLILTVLDLRSNLISGTLPCLPTSLEQTWLDHNVFTGDVFPLCPRSSFPDNPGIFSVADNLLDSFGDGPHLMFGREIYVQDNMITGTIPPDIFCSGTVRIFNMSNNAIDGTLPSSLSLGVRELYLSDNFISGTVPLAYGYAQLTTLNLSNNKFSSALPLRERDDTLMDVNYICSGLFQGEIMVGGLFESLQVALLDHNEFSGDVDFSWISYHYPALATLRVDSNLLTGQPVVDVPPYSDSSHLRAMDISNNGLSGFLDSAFPDAFPLLEQFKMGNNLVSGTLPPSLALGCPYLQVISVQGNVLSGALPVEIASLSQLQELVVSDNGIGSDFPVKYGQLQSLTSLSIHHTKLTGCLPPFVSIDVCTVDTTGTSLTLCSGDVIPPKVICPTKQAVAVDPGLSIVDCSSGNPSCPPSMQDFLDPEVIELGGTGHYVLTYTPTTFVKGVRTVVTFTAVDAAGNQGSCSVSVTLVSQVELVAIEVTQAVQDWTHSVPLVAAKSTLVRAFVQIADNDTRDPAKSVILDGYLEGFRFGESLGRIAKVNHEGALSITKYISAGRGFIRGSFNFLLPSNWVEPGDLSVCFYALPSEEYPDTYPLMCHEQDTAPATGGDCCVTVTFELVSKPCFRFIKVMFYDEKNELRAVSPEVLREQWRRFRSMLPIPAHSVAEFRQFDFVYRERPPLRVVNNALDATRVIDNLSQRCWYIGVLNGNGGGLAELNGETAAYYAGQAETTYSCGYARNRGVHEFLHNMGIDHARQGNVTACSNVGNDSPEEYEYLQPVGGTDYVVRPTLGPMDDKYTLVWGTDPQLAATGAPSVLAFSSPRFVFALMSYCQPLNFFGCQGRWIDRSTYVQAMYRITERAPTGPQPLSVDTPADISMFRGSIELNGDIVNVHLGPVLQMCTTGDAFKKPTGSPSPYSILVKSGSDTLLNETITTRAATADLLSSCTSYYDANCATTGPSSTYGSYGTGYVTGGGCGFCFGSFDQFTQFSFDFYPMFSFDFYPMFSFDFYPMFSFDGFPHFTHNNETYMLFDGWPYFSFDQSSLPNEAEQVQQGTFVSADFAGFFDEIQGNYTDFDGVSLGVGSHQDGISSVDFSLVGDNVLPGPYDVLSSPITIQFSFTDQLEQRIVAVYRLSAHAPTITNISMVPQGVVMDSEVSLCFEVSDDDGGYDPLYVTVQYCPDYTDGGLCNCEVFTLDHEVLDTVFDNKTPRPICLTYQKSKLRKTDAAVFRMYVSDGLRSSDAITPPFTVANNAPYVQIVFPTEGTRSAQGLRQLYLSGQADDLEDGQLDSSCSWYEVTDPNHSIWLAMGIDVVVDVSQLGPGDPINGCLTRHLIRLRCFDEDYDVGVDFVSHTIVGTNGPPVIVCPGTVQSTIQASCSAAVPYDLPVATDSCGITTLVPTLMYPDWAVPGAVFPQGDTIVTYRTVEPITKKVATCDFAVSVRDLEPPVLTCGNISMPAVRILGGDGGVVTYSVATTDNCVVAESGAVNPAFRSGSVVPFGTHEVEYAALDEAGNSGMCKFQLSVFEVGCFATCTGDMGPYNFQFVITASTTGPSALTPEQTCLWNFVVGSVVGVPNPDDPCIVFSSGGAPARRRLQQGGELIHATQLNFATGAEALRAQEVILAAIADSSFLAQLQFILGFIQDLTLTSYLVADPGGVSGDPHFSGPCGQHFDFMGAPGESFCLMTSEALHVNAKMAGPRTPLANARVVAHPAESHNTWIQELGILYGNASITIAADSVPGSAFKAYHGRVFVNGVEVTNAFASKATFAQGDLRVERRKTRVKLTLGVTATLQVDVVRASFWEAGQGPGRNFLNLKILRLARSANWHGVLGETFRKPCDKLTDDEGDTIAAIVGSGVSKYKITETGKYRTSGILARDCAVSKPVQEV